MTTTEPTETIVLIPEVRIPADFEEKVKQARKLAKKLAPKVSELGRLAMEIRDANDEALRALGAAGLPLDADGVLDAVGIALGWVSDHGDAGEVGVWNLMSELEDMLSGDDISRLDTTGLRNSELHRGGERDVPQGAKVQIALPNERGADVVEMVVFGRPSDTGVYRLLYNGEHFTAPHDEVKAGLSVQKAS